MPYSAVQVVHLHLRAHLESPLTREDDLIRAEWILLNAGGLLHPRGKSGKSCAAVQADLKDDRRCPAQLTERCLQWSLRGSHDSCVLSPLLGGRTVTGSSLHEATSKKQT